MRARPSLVLVATSLAAFTATLDNTVVAVALRDVQRDLDVGVSGLQGVVTSYTVALAALLLTGGALADVLGRRRTLLAGLAVFAGASALCATADSASALIGWRALQGAGAALVLPGALAVLASAYPDPARRGRAVGVWAATGALALVAGPIVGGLLVEARGWPWVFWVNLPLCALVALIAAVAPGEPATPGRRLDLPGQVLAAGGLAALTYAVVRLGRDGMADAALPAAAGCVLLVAFLAVERRAADPLLPLGLLKDRPFVGATTAAFAAALAIFVVLVFVSLFLQLVTDLEALPTALRLLPLTVGLVVAAPPAARLAVARGVRLPVVAGLVVAAAGVAATAAVLDEQVGTTALALTLGVTGAGLGLTGAPVVAQSLDAVSSDRSGLAAATVNVARELGGVVAVAGLGALVVARLAADLTSRLLALGVAPGPAEVVVDTVLRGETSTDGVLAATDGTVALEALLQLRTAAEASFVGSTRAALVGAAVTLLLSAAVAARTLRAR